MTVIFCSQKTFDGGNSASSTSLCEHRANCPQSPQKRAQPGIPRQVPSHMRQAWPLSHDGLLSRERTGSRERDRRLSRAKAHDGTAKAASSHTAKGGGLLLELGRTTPHPLAFTMPGRRRSTSGYCSMTIINNDSIAAPIRCVELCQVDETFAATANTPIIVSAIRAARCMI